MLQDIRNNAQGTIAKVIIGLLIVSLSIWGMDAIVGGFSGEPEVATVNGEDITEREFLRVVQMESQRRLSQMESPDPSLLDEDRIRREVLDSLIQEEVLIQDARDQGLQLSDEDIDALITQIPQFQVDGTFNRDRFVAAVRNMGMGVGEFREAMRRQYVVNQIRSAINDSALVPRETARDLLAIQNQTRDFRTLTLDAAMVADQVEVTDAEVQDWYEANGDQFMRPERVDVQYLELSRDTLAQAIEVSEEELRALYEERVAELEAAEERRAAHILIEDGDNAEARLEEIQEKLAAGEDFAELAREYSDDTLSAAEGGDLGFAGRDVFDQAFTEALYGLDEGEVSEPVSGPYGTHIIKLLDTRQAEVPSYEEMKPQLRRELAQRRAEERFSSARAELADLAYAEENLDYPAEQLDLEIRTRSDITRNGGEPPFDHQGLIRQLFSGDVLEDGYNTELIEVGDGVSVVARVTEHKPASQLPLDEVEQDIRARLEQQQIREALEERASALIARLRDGATIDELDPTGDGWTEHTDVSRNQPVVAGPVQAQVFSLPRPREDGPRYGMAPVDSSVVVIALDQVTDGEVAEDSEELRQLRQFLASIQGQQEYSAYQQYLRNRAEITRP